MRLTTDQPRGYSEALEASRRETASARAPPAWYQWGLLRSAAHLGIGLSAGSRLQVGSDELIAVGLGLQTIGWPAVLPSDFTVAIWLGRFCGSRGREVGTIGPFVSLL